LPRPIVERTENGKPRLNGDPLFFSLSHSGDTVALAVSDAPIGLDCERRRVLSCPALFRRLTDGERREDFFRLWTAKEAYVKFLGGTLARTLPALVYENGILFDRGEPVDAALVHAEREGMVYCVCTPQKTEIVFRSV
ncbi:MAG: 4'-phosphopantetheinyl transferase family protein, partial [Candidatus Gallimonas sp.]